MKNRPNRVEWIVVGLAISVGLVLRCWHLEFEAVEHFDEGIYASVLWHDVTLNAPYPAKDFYAPPLLSFLIELTSLIPGLAKLAPFVPSVCFGTASIWLFWWIARNWFGRAAGFVAVFMVALSDFHIQYSRMALTDVTALFWIALSVACGVSAIDRQSLRGGLLAGFFCGLAWWTKYTGWLPLAILLSGTSLWWIWLGRKRPEVKLKKVLLILSAIIVAAVATFSPWWYHLQSVGGYAAINSNHAKFVTASGGTLLETWRSNMTEQLTFQLFQDGIFGAISLGIGVLIAALIRWQAAVGSTWNANAEDKNEPGFDGNRAWFPPRELATRFFLAGLALTVLSLRIRTPLMMTCLALGGFAGMYLWPVLHRAWQRQRTGDLSPTAPQALPLLPSDLDVAASTDPSLAFCVTVCWFSGMLVVTPLYHPYARLFFPLLASIWLAAAGGVSWWLESNLSVARRSPPSTRLTGWQYLAQRLVGAMAMGAVVASFLELNPDGELGLVAFSEVVSVPGYDDRRSIRDAAETIADACVASVRGEFHDHQQPLVPIGEIIRPEEVRKAARPESAGESASALTDVGSQLSQGGMTPKPKYSLEDRRAQKLVVYVYGDPALLYQLNQTGVLAAPVSHLNLTGPGGSSPTVPTFVILGPHAKRTEGFWDERLARASQLDEVTQVPYRPGIASLMDLFSIKWLQSHPEAETQVLEVHRVR